MPAGSPAEDLSPSPLVLAALRRTTASHHRDLEALLPLGPVLSLESYVRVIQGFDAFLSAWEPRVAAALPGRLRPWLARRSRWPMARRDLHRLGVAPAASSDRHLRRLQLPGNAAAFGSLYVLEGSALGGQVIAPRLDRQLNLQADTGAAYFAGWGAHTGAMWREFREKLELEVGASDEACMEACSAAVQTFDALAATFRKVLSDSVAA